MKRMSSPFIWVEGTVVPPLYGPREENRKTILIDGFFWYPHHMGREKKIQKNPKRKNPKKSEKKKSKKIRKEKKGP